jgi:hypothetical protein
MTVHITIPAKEQESWASETPTPQHERR